MPICGGARAQSDGMRHGGGAIDLNDGSQTKFRGQGHRLGHVIDGSAGDTHLRESTLPIIGTGRCEQLLHPSIEFGPMGHPGRIRGEIRIPGKTRVSQCRSQCGELTVIADRNHHGPISRRVDLIGRYRRVRVAHDARNDAPGDISGCLIDEGGQQR